MSESFETVRSFFEQFHARTREAFERFEPSARFVNDAWGPATTDSRDLGVATIRSSRDAPSRSSRAESRDAAAEVSPSSSSETTPPVTPSGVEGRASSGLTCILHDGETFERAAVNFSSVEGMKLPAAATARHPELAGKPFRVCGVSIVTHPKNPYVPTSHCNVRFFKTDGAWWFGGGFDLTPYYPFEEDVAAWHQAARAACEPFGAHVYPRLKADCDTYFYLPHRKERRGVGGLFVDDLHESSPVGGNFEHCFGLVSAIADGFLRAYQPIVERRRATPHAQRERDFQLYRRGRYVEFNLVYDRGTQFGLQFGGRIESILGSMPPLAAWSYGVPKGLEDDAARLAAYLI